MGKAIIVRHNTPGGGYRKGDIIPTSSLGYGVALNSNSSMNALTGATITYKNASYDEKPASYKMLSDGKSFYTHSRGMDSVRIIKYTITGTAIEIVNTFEASGSNVTPNTNGSVLTNDFIVDPNDENIVYVSGRSEDASDNSITWVLAVNMSTLSKKWTWEDPLGKYVSGNTRMAYDTSQSKVMALRDDTIYRLNSSTGGLEATHTFSEVNGSVGLGYDPYLDCLYAGFYYGTKQGLCRIDKNTWSVVRISSSYDIMTECFFDSTYLYFYDLDGFYKCIKSSGAITAQINFRPRVVTEVNYNGANCFALFNDDGDYPIYILDRNLSSVLQLTSLTTDGNFFLVNNNELYTTNRSNQLCIVGELLGYKIMEVQ